jgi:hypothetical protein
VNALLAVAAFPSGFVTTTLVAPAFPAGVVAVIWVALAVVTAVAGCPPTVTVAPDKKFVPVMVIAVPPAVGPPVGLTPEIVGAGAVYVKAFDRVALPPSGFVTMTATAPAALAGVVAVSWVALAMLTFVAACPPTVTVAPVTKLVPVMVIAVPPVVGPVVGATALMVGELGGGAA